MNKLKLNDEVIVLSGKNKGKIGKIKNKKTTKARK